jgi:uncharacterized membrane protein
MKLSLVEIRLTKDRQRCPPPHRQARLPVERKPACFRVQHRPAYRDLAAMARRRTVAYTRRMEEFFDALVRWLHILSAVIFIGPQVFLAFVAMPALRNVEDAQARQAIVRAITRGFGLLGGAAIVVLVATGLYNFYAVPEVEIYFDNADRYRRLFELKMLLVTIVIVLTALHGMLFGRRLRDLQEANASEEELAKARRWSMAASMSTLAASIAILLCAALMSSTWSKL